MKSILGIGNALTDILAVLPDDSLLNTFHLPKGSMQHVDMETGDGIWAALKPLGVKYVAGGSAANTIPCTAILGMPSGFIGKIGDDELGELFKSDQEQYGVRTRLLKSPRSSGRSMVFVSGGNAERTFAVYLGAALDLVPEDLRPEWFEGYDYSTSKATSCRTRASCAGRWSTPAGQDASSPSTWPPTTWSSPTRPSCTTSWRNTLT